MPMSFSRVFRRSLLLALIAICGGLGLGGVRAQDTGTIRGMVIELETGRPLPDTRVIVVGLGVETTTDSAGIFELTDLPPGQIVLSFRSVGLARLTERVEVMAGRVTGGVFDMPNQTQVLDAIGVTVTAGADEEGGRKAVVEGDKLEDQSSLNRVLDGVSGVQLVRTSGEVGAGYFIRIRGVTSLTFARRPAVFIDGVRVDMTFRSSASSLDLIKPSQIGRVEVLRGSAAGARYGPDAANGVILITTKRGN